jgi:hypothetical protein
MRTPIRLLWAVAILAPAWVTASAQSSAPQVIGTQQINRFEAIRQLQETVKQNPKSLADWVILGELAHEVAIDLPADQADPYYKMSREAYENALELAPDNRGLQAAVQFAKDQEQGLEQFEKSRSATTKMYLDARRRDLAETQYTPSLRVFGAPTPPPAAMTGRATPTGAPTGDIGTARPTTVNPTLDNTAATASSTRNDPSIRKSATGGDVVVSPPETASSTTSGPSGANFGVRQFYSSPTYQTYVPSQGTPLTYQQFSSSYYPPTGAPGQAGRPVTLQRYYSQQGLPIPGDPTGRPAIPGATTVPGGTTTTPRGTTTTTPRGTTTTPGGTTTTPPATPR